MQATIATVAAAQERPHDATNSTDPTPRLIAITIGGGEIGINAMAPGGVEPPRTDSKSVALSAELRGHAAEGTGL